MKENKYIENLIDKIDFLKNQNMDLAKTLEELKKKLKPNQVEGLCLMWYQCEEPKCAKRERIWNSRPRVTPFCISCSACDGTMQHVDWRLDEYTPDHMAKKDERIFVDWSREAAEEYQKDYIKKWWYNKKTPMSRNYKSQDEALEKLMETWRFGMPHMITLEHDFGK